MSDTRRNTTAEAGKALKATKSGHAGRPRRSAYDPSGQGRGRTRAFRMVCSSPMWSELDTTEGTW